MNTHETYVSLETAKLLKQAGFDWEINSCYNCYGIPTLSTDMGVYKNYNEKNENIISAPTLDVAQRWLREVKGFMVETTFITDEYSILYQANLYEVVSEKSKGRVSELISVVKGQSEFKRTYEEAQESGIKKVLEMILEKGE